MLVKKINTHKQTDRRTQNNTYLVSLYGKSDFIDLANHESLYVYYDI